MKIVSFNVNGLRPRAREFGGLKQLLDAIDADIICLQVRRSQPNWHGGLTVTDFWRGLMKYYTFLSQNTYTLYAVCGFHV